jgi:putative ATPase
LNAGTGLLTWDLVRRLPEGGVWALARDERTGQALREQAARLPELQRPVVMVGEPVDLTGLLATRGDAAVRFDALVGRNALGPGADKASTARVLYSVLREGGVISLAEGISRQAQRLYGLVDLGPLGADLAARLARAEEAIYAIADDPLVNWEPADLERGLREAGFAAITVKVEYQTADVHVGPALLERWFGPGDGRGRDSYAAHLSALLSRAEVAAVRDLFARQLLNQTVSWHSAVAFVVGRR